MQVEAVELLAQAGADLALTEQQQRTQRIFEAEERLTLGDATFAARDYGQAMEHYRRALSLLPDGPVADDRRSALKERFANASTMRAHELVTEGKLDEAGRMLDAVLKAEMLPNYQPARKLREKLADPERVNPGLSPEHLENVRTVSQLLQKAEGQMNLGLFAEAYETCESLLQIDRHNRAARRMMERINAHKSEYYEAAYDQTRSEFLAEVAAAWQIPVDKIGGVVGELPGVEPGQLPVADVSINQRLRTLVLPRYEVRSERLNDALRVLEEMIIEAQPGQPPIRFVLDLGDPNSELAQSILNRPIDVVLADVPAREVVEYLASQSGTEIYVDTFAVRLVPAGRDSGTVSTRTFKVPSGFLMRPTEDSSNDDPFGSAPKRTQLRARQNAQEFLESAGVAFTAPNARAIHNPSNNTLTVVNTDSQLRLVDSIVASLRQDIPLQIVLTTTFVEVNQTDLGELGFDWVFDGARLNSGGNSFWGGGTASGDEAFADGIPGVPFGGQPNPQNPVTAGLRSGRGMFALDPLEAVVATGSTDSLAGQTIRAPGALAYRGIFTDADFMAIMRAISQKKGSDVLLRPSLVIRPGETATLFSGREFIYPTEYEPPELPNQVGQEGGAFPVVPAQPAAFETRELGVVLEVEANASSESNLVDVRIAPEFSEFLGFINYGSPITADGQDALGNSVPLEITPNRILMPIFETKRLNTSVTVMDGQTIVIGGLKRDSREKVEDKVPLLGDIPLVGRFFRNDGLRRNARSVIIFVKVRVVDPSGASVFDSVEGSPPVN